MTKSDQRTTETFVALADTLIDDFDIVDFLDMLTQRCVKLLDVAAVGVLLVDHRGSLNLVAASTEQARLLELFQLQNEEGPCLDSYRTGRPVLCPDLTEAMSRWPRFAPAAVDVGFSSVCALPMRLREQVIGGLNLFGSTVGDLSGGDTQLAQALANIATVGILHERALRDRDLVVEQLQTALNSRISVEQAKGVLAERLQLSVADAYVLLREYARANNRHLADVAEAVVVGSIDIRPA